LELPPKNIYDSILHYFDEKSKHFDKKSTVQNSKMYFLFALHSFFTAKLYIFPVYPVRHPVFVILHECCCMDLSPLPLNNLFIFY